MLDFVTLDLKDAFKQPGCPICHRRLQTEARYSAAPLARERVEVAAHAWEQIARAIAERSETLVYSKRINS